MTPYQPRLPHALFTTLLSILFAYLWAIAATERIARVMVYASMAFFAITIVIIFLMGEQSHYWSVVSYLEALIKIDPDLRNALALSVPSLRLVATRGRIAEVVDGTLHVEKKHLLLFLQDSTKEHTASKRDWHTTDRPLWAWNEIYQWLLKRGMVGEFAVGPDSYAWRGSSYHNLIVYWFGAYNIPDLGSEAQVYGMETETQSEEYENQPPPHRN